MSYYMGDYYRGDPGIGSFFSKALGFVGKLGIPGVSTAASAGSAILSKVAGGGVTAAAQGAARSAAGAVSQAIIKHPVLSAAGAAGALGTMAGAGALVESRMGAAKGKHVLRKCGQPLKHGGVGKCHRSMNVCNPRALRRAIRRTRGFAKLAMRTIHIVHPKKKGRFGGFKTRRRK